MDASVADTICASALPPRVALALAGAARTLAQPLLYKSIGSNLLRAFGGRITLFAVIKLDDDRGDRSKAAGGLIHADERAVRFALEYIGQTATRASLHVIKENHWPAAPCSGVRTGGSSRVQSLFASLQQQLAARRMVAHLIAEDERAHNEQHDLIIYTRPDVAWLHAVRPWCFWDLSSSARLHDWVWIVPRRNFSHFLEVPHAVLDSRCAHPPHSLPETFTRHIFDAPELFEELPGILTRQNRSDVPERASIARNKYQLRWTRPVLNASARLPGKSDASVPVGDEVTWLNPCANVLSVSPLSQMSNTTQ